MSLDFAIEITNLNKSYGPEHQKTQALDNISLNIRKGSIFGLLGPNGAGKSTIINTIAGLTNKDSGVIKILGYDLNKESKKAKQQLGIVPQELVLDPFFSVKETLDIYAGYYGIRQKDRKTDEIIAALSLTDKANIKSRGLSGGMKRRLLVAKALVHSPEILILDEPTAGVDIELRKQLWDYVTLLNKNGTTIILTTHYLEEAEKLCDEVAIINKGSIIAQDKTESLKKIFGNKKITVQIKEASKKTKDKLSTLGLIVNSDNQIIISSNNGEIKIANLISTLNNEDISICDIKTEESNLEDIFRILINKKDDN